MCYGGKKMNTIGINHNLDRPRIKKLLTIGLIGSVITGIGDFLLGFGEEMEASGFAEGLMANAMNLSDSQLIWGGLLGVFGIFLEGLAYFAVYRLIADAAPKYAHIIRSGIFGYIWLAPIGCHMNAGIMNYAYKNLLALDPEIAAKAAKVMIYWFGIPIWGCLVLFWLPMIIVQYKAFAEGLTPYPSYAKWFNIFIGAIPAFLISAAVGPRTALGSGIGTMFLCFGNAFVFGGLLRTLPDEKTFDAFARRLKIS